ncbi:hypothetical protein H0H92_008200 [Tricholoma furcatifolium]|nr:hypothetical protein H0H92_008200 [Tricholoma furcatifolium]
MTTQSILQSIAETLTHKPPFCTEVLPTTSHKSTLFYKQDSIARWIDLTQASESQLDDLTNACVPATFGQDKEDVYDESYRKAGKMDIDTFSTRVNVEKIGIDKRIREQLLDASHGNKVIEAELYKLNIYGKGSFFKPHKDTPRGGDMFGSLVIVFPTPHEGGGLVLRHAGQEWTFDSATMISQNAKPCIAYIAFYSDVEHEVNVVQSGYRVTLTYNLFLRRAPKLPSSLKPVASDINLLHQALSAALDNPAFLPDGGCIGFGLSFQYPVGAEDKLEPSLKGSDATIYQVCKGLSLGTSLNAIYQDLDDCESVLVPFHCVPGIGGQYLDGEDVDFCSLLCEEFKGKIVVGPSDAERPRGWFNRQEWQPKIEIEWVVPLTKYSHFKSTFVTHYGNEPGEAYTYADLCICVTVGPFGKRQREEKTSDEKEANGKKATDDDEETDDDEAWTPDEEETPDEEGIIDE